MINDQIAEEKELGRSQFFFLPRPCAKLIFDIMFTESAARIVNSYHANWPSILLKKWKSVCVSSRNIFFLLLEKTGTSASDSEKLY